MKLSLPLLYITILILSLSTTLAQLKGEDLNNGTSQVIQAASALATNPQDVSNWIFTRFSDPISGQWVLGYLNPANNQTVAGLWDPILSLQVAEFFDPIIGKWETGYWNPASSRWVSVSTLSPTSSQSASAVNSATPQSISAVNSASPQGTLAVNATDPRDASAVNSASPQGTSAVNSASPQGTSAVNSASPQGTSAVNSASPQGTSAANATDPRDASAVNSANPQDVSPVNTISCFPNNISANPDGCIYYNNTWMCPIKLTQHNGAGNSGFGSGLRAEREGSGFFWRFLFTLVTIVAFGFIASVVYYRYQLKQHRIVPSVPKFCPKALFPVSPDVHQGTGYNFGDLDVEMKNYCAPDQRALIQV